MTDSGFVAAHGLEALLLRLRSRPEEEPAGRRRRVLQTAPAGAFLGGWIGYLAAPLWQRPAWSGALIVAAAIVAICYTAAWLEALVKRGLLADSDSPTGLVVAGVFDALFGAGLGQLAAATIGIPRWESLTAGAGIFVAYGAIIRGIWFGDMLDRGLVSLLGGGAGSSAPDYSYAASLVASGRPDAAIEAYEEWCIRRPRDPVPYIRIARIRQAQGRYDQALAWYRRARTRAKLDPAGDIFTARQIADLCITQLERPADAVPELQALATRHIATPAGRWARSELARLRVRQPS